MAYDDATNMAMILGGMYGPNPYSHYPGGIPPTSYRGTVTDAMGKPITPPVHPGTTINQTQDQPAATPKLNSTQNWWNELSAPSAMNPSGNAKVGMNEWGAFMGPQGAIDRASPGFLQPGMQGYQGTGAVNGVGNTGAVAPHQQQSLQSSAAAPDTSYQDALDMLSNPGKIETPGAKVPITQPVSNQPSVLDAFLKGQSGGTGAGNYSNEGFFTTLNRLRPQAGGNA